MTRPWVRAVLFGVLILAFILVNRGAYKGYFLGDDIDNVYWTPLVPLSDFGKLLISPQFSTSNFRPLGHFYFRVLAQTAGRNYPWYVAGLQAFHLLNVWLLYLLLRRMKLDWVPAASGALFFAFQMAVFDAFWKPMYIFDVLCATFCLLSLLSYSSRRFVLSFVCMWLAYKAKEPAIGMPVLLALWEWWFGEKRWKRLIPFFAFSLMFGVQAMFHRPAIGSVYRMRFTFKAFLESTAYYTSQVFFAPFAGLATVALPFVFRDRRVWFGVAGFWMFLMPMLFLPSRLFPAYLYVPLVALSIAFAAIAAGRRLAAIAVFFALWLPLNHWQMRVQRKAMLAASDESRHYVETLAAYFQSNPIPEAVVIDDDPEPLHTWGTVSAVRLVSGNPKIMVRHSEDADVRDALDKSSVLLVSWDRHLRRVGLLARRQNDPPVSYIDLGQRTPVWLLLDGWYQRSGAFRWIQPRATAKLFRPAGCRGFQLTVNAGHQLMERVGTSTVELLLNGQSMGVRRFTTTGIHETAFDLPSAPSGEQMVEFRVTPVYQDRVGERQLGIAVVAFGFTGE